MTCEEKRETLQTFASFPTIVRQAICAGKVFSDLEKQNQKQELEAGVTTDYILGVKPLATDGG